MPEYWPDVRGISNERFDYGQYLEGYRCGYSKQEGSGRNLVSTVFEVFPFKKRPTEPGHLLPGCLLRPARIGDMRPAPLPWRSRVE